MSTVLSHSHLLSKRMTFKLVKVEQTCFQELKPKIDEWING
jgi:hypothetical protein